MNKAHTVWVSSYPRSGNTLLRTILWQCFGCRSGSLYINDMDGNRALEEYTGHIERTADKKLIFPPNVIPFVKTHEYASDDSPAIYVLRDGRAVSVSLWNFYNDYFSLEQIINGQCHKFGTWADHVHAWNPWVRPNTLLLRYEDMTNNLPLVLKDISRFLNMEILKKEIPDRNAIAVVGEKFVKKKSDWRTGLTGADLERFLEINGDMLKKAGYLD